MKILLRGHRLGIPARLTMLALVTALPLAAVGSFAILRSVDDQRAQMQSDVKQMVAALRIRGTSIVLHDTHAQQLLSTNRPFGEPLPRATNSEMHDRVVATGKPQISDLIMGAVLKRPILTVGVPVFRDGEVVYVLAMGVG